MERRDYQEDIIKDVLSTTDDVLVVAPTGSGKTYMAKRIAEGLRERVLFVTPRIDLVSQTVEAFDGNCDILWGNYKDTHKHITVASRQTLALRNLTFEGWIVILDEAHIGLPTSKKLVDQIRPKRLIGLTATPERMDGLSFIKKNDDSPRYASALFDRVLEKVTIQDLQKDGYLAELDYSAAKYNGKLAKIQTKFDEMRYSQFQDIVETPEAKANLAAFLKGHEDQKPFLIFTPDVKSAHYWKEEINKFGYNLATVDGSMKKKERQAVYDSVKNGEYDGIVNCALLTYGFDMPCAKTVVLIRNIKSRPLYIQVIGRVLRPFENKKAIVYDMAGSCWNFCSLKHPNLFAEPIKYAVEGFENCKPSDMEGDIESVRDLIGDDQINDYIEDPLDTLLKVLYTYKENFEISLHEAKLLAEEKAKKETKKLSKELERTQVALASAGQVTDPKLWFKLPAAFEWFRRKFPSILRPLGYDKSKREELFNDPEWTKAYYHKVFEELPLLIKPEDYSYCKSQVDSYSNWWLNHFAQDYYAN